MCAGRGGGGENHPRPAEASVRRDRSLEHPPPWHRGLNIDASRISSPGEVIETKGQGQGEDGFASNAVYGNYRGGFETHQTEGQKLGRWPANVVLQHLDGCRCGGIKRVKKPLKVVATLYEEQPYMESMGGISP